MKKDERTNNNLLNTTHKTKDRSTRTSQNTWCGPKCPRRV